MRIIRKFLLGYLIISGLAAHGLAMAVIMLRPDLTLRAQMSVENWLARRWPEVFASDAQLAAQTKVDLFEVVRPWPPAPAHWQTPPGKARISDRIFASILEASKALTDGETLYIGAGTYTEPMILTASRIRIVGDGPVHIQDTQAEGKAAVLMRGHDTGISNIECSGIRVSDGNGACVRLEGRNLDLDHVYFHDSQQGILTGAEPGEVVIRNSWFVRLGQGGSSHGIYIGGGNLEIYRSIFLASRDEGHEIKTRARTTHIASCVIASLDGVDSRLIDASNGGRLTIENSVLEEGPLSANLDAVGYGLEKDKLHNENSITITDNTIILERVGGSRLLNLGIEPDALTISGNVIVGPDAPDPPGDNEYYSNRKEAGLRAYPILGR
ncbi:MAG: hypothetical protein ACRERU_15325 [Methylococcales bacterium]